MTFSPVILVDFLPLPHSCQFPDITRWSLSRQVVTLITNCCCYWCPFERVKVQDNSASMASIVYILSCCYWYCTSTVSMHSY